MKSIACVYETKINNTAGHLFKNESDAWDYIQNILAYWQGIVPDPFTGDMIDEEHLLTKEEANKVKVYVVKKLIY